MQHTPVNCGWAVEMGTREMRLGGNSALSLVCNLQGEIEEWRKDVDDDWERSSLISSISARLRTFLKIFTSAPRGAHRVQVLAGVVDLWDRLYQHTSSADVIFVARGGREHYAHSTILTLASPVLSAMLQSGTWAEGKCKRIEIQDSSAAIEDFLSLIYTGGLSAKQLDEGSCDSQLREGSKHHSSLTDPASHLLEVAEIACRYQVNMLVAPLVSRLRGSVSTPTFDCICSFALRHTEKDLQKECEKVASSLHLKMGSDEWGAWLGSLSSSVQEFVRNSLGLQSQKRRRQL